MGLFVVLCGGRSGSRWLCQILNSHPQITCDKEIFNTGSPFEFSKNNKPLKTFYNLNNIYYQFRKTPGKRQKLIELKRKAFQSSVEMLKQKTIEHDFYGFKLLYEQDTFYDKTFLKNTRLIEEIKKQLEIQIIQLYRINKLKQFISGRLAIKNNCWVRDYPSELIEINNARYKHYSKMQHLNYNFYKHKNNLSINYEELSSNTVQTCNKILNYLGLPSYSKLNYSLSKKQKKLPLYESIINYHEMVKLL